MSYSTINVVNTKSVRAVHEVQNSWGSAPAIWNYLSTCFLGLSHMPLGFGAEGEAALHRLWALVTDKQVPWHLRLCHAWTFDYVVCPPERLVELAQACESAGAEIKRLYPNRVNHWPAFSYHLAKLPRLSRRVVGVGLTCTSVSDIWLEWHGDPRPHSIFEICGRS